LIVSVIPINPTAHLFLMLLAASMGCHPDKTARLRETSVNDITMKEPFLDLLWELDSTLLALQQTDPASDDHGGIWCPACSLYHTRAAEALYPLAYLGSEGADPVLTGAAVDAGNWLIRQQQPDGSWKETPEEWTGTTTDQCLMMALACPLLQEQLTEAERVTWLRSMKRAGDWLVSRMDHGFASINYVATTAATLAVLNQVVPDPVYVRKAETLARSVVARMDDDGFITGEGGRVDGIKYGTDLVYNMEMSLWGLALYARVTGDEEVYERTLKSLYSHLPFVLPDGSLDGSWGIRSNKWTCYGGATSDGCQVLFSLFADRDPVFRTAALCNLAFIRTCMTGGMVAYGPHHDRVMNGPPCIYPTFAKAKNLAMAHALCTADAGPVPPLPSDRQGIRTFPTLSLATVRTGQLHATVTAYNYKDPRGLERKYMYRPSGGAVSNLWLDGYGYLQASSQSEYHRWEPMSFPVMPQVQPLTPRIEFTKSGVVYSSLYEYDATLDPGGPVGDRAETGFRVEAHGQLKNSEFREGGVGYTSSHVFRDGGLEKTIRLRYYEVPDTIRITEPLILYDGATVSRKNHTTFVLARENLQVEFRLLSPGSLLSEGSNPEQYISCFPALMGYPLQITLVPEPGSTGDEITYEYTIKRKEKDQ